MEFKQGDDMQIRTAKVTDIRSILVLSEQINRQSEAPMVFAPPSRSFGDSEEYWLGLMMDPLVPSLLRFKTKRSLASLLKSDAEQRGELYSVAWVSLWVNTIVVNDQIQSQGVGKALMKSFNQWPAAEER